MTSPEEDEAGGVWGLRPQRVQGSALASPLRRLAAVACGLALGLCGMSAARAAVVLNLVAADYGTGPSSSSQTYWQGIADAFHAAHPAITVKVLTVNWNDFDTKVQTMVQNRQFPDITEGDYFSSYAQEGLLYRASDVLSDAGDLMPVFRALGSYGGVQYGMPFTTSARAMFYNKKLFAQAGLSAPPATWAALKTDAGKIAALGKIGYGMPLGPEEAQAETLLWFLGNGGGYQAPDGKWVINSASNVATLGFMTGLVKDGDTEPHPGTKNRALLLEQFAQGQVGMLDGLPALYPIVQKAGVLRDGDWGTAPIAGKDGALATTLGVCDFIAAFKNGGSKAAAIKAFLDFAMADKYQVAFAEEYNLLPGTTSAASAFVKQRPAFQPFVAALPHAVQYPSAPVWAQVKTQFQQTIGTALGADGKAVLDNIEATALKGG